MDAKYVQNKFKEKKMKLAIIGSRDLTIDNLEKYLPEGITEIVSGGARGVDTSAANYARKNAIKLTEFLPDYARYRGGAPQRRNEQIALYADEVIAFWNGSSKGTVRTLSLFRKLGKKITVIEMKKEILEVVEGGKPKAENGKL